jgi:hypothetical protein
MKKTVQIIMVVLASALFLMASVAWAKPGSKAQCKKDCDIAKQSLLKACDKNKDPKVREKCKTMGSKKVMEECMSRCQQGRKK